MNHIQAKIDEYIGTIVLNNAEKRNALSSALIEELIDTLLSFQKAKVRAVILRAPPGVKVWSAGHDIHELPASGRDPLAYNDPLEQAIRAVRHFTAPIIALIEGSVWGGACELAFCCDIRIGAPNASFTITPAKIGVPYNPAGLLRILSTVKLSLMKEMFFTARSILAERALAVGMLNHVVDFKEIEKFTYAMAAEIVQLSPLSIAVTKEQMRLLVDAHPMTPEVFEQIQELRRIVYDSHDYQEGRQAFLEKRKPQFKGI